MNSNRIGCLGIVGILLIIFGIIISLTGVGAAIGVPSTLIGFLICKVGIHGFYKKDEQRRWNNRYKD